MWAERDEREAYGKAEIPRLQPLVVHMDAVIASDICLPLHTSVCIAALFCRYLGRKQKVSSKPAPGNHFFSTNLDLPRCHVSPQIWISNVEMSSTYDILRVSPFQDRCSENMLTISSAHDHGHKHGHVAFDFRDTTYLSLRYRFWILV